MSCAKTAELMEILFGLWTLVGSRKHVFDGAWIPHVKGQLLGERTCRGMPNNIFVVNRSICFSGCRQVGRRKHMFICIC